jgi:uncharacterized membrane protein YphA (DoxX/SURF4 family)
MTLDDKVTAKELGEKALERGKDLLHQGNVRHVVVRQGSGTKVFEINLTLAVVLGVIAFAFAWWLMLILLFLGYIAKWQVEVIREIDDEDEMIEVTEA